jgi:hypothetical protein
LEGERPGKTLEESATCNRAVARLPQHHRVEDQQGVGRIAACGFRVSYRRSSCRFRGCASIAEHRLLYREDARNSYAKGAKKCTCGEVDAATPLSVSSSQRTLGSTFRQRQLGSKAD